MREAGAGAAGGKAGGADGLSHGTVRAGPGLSEARAEAGLRAEGGRAGGCGVRDGAEVAAPYRSAARQAPPCCCPESGWRAARGSRAVQLCATRKAAEPWPRAGLC